MGTNDHLAPVLDSYAALTQPGFALMVTAPWGAGKTHTIKKWLTGKPHLYVSLFGASSPDAITERLLEALVESSDFKLPKGTTDLLQGVFKKVTGAQIDLTGLYRRQVLKALPDLIVFDDLERTRMKGPELLSAINQYVEHEGRNVVLLANEEELDKSKDFRKWREKVVGRSVAVNASVDGALTAFLRSVCHSDARHYLESEQVLLRDVFDMGGTQNLRLLRQSILEFATFYHQLPADVSKQLEPMRSLLATFTALTIAFHEGREFTRTDLRQAYDTSRAVWKVNGRKGEEPKASGIELLQEKFKKCPLVDLSGSAISGDLAEKVIADGHAPTPVVAASMRECLRFLDEESAPWITLWSWRMRGEDAVAKALSKVNQSIANHEFTEPAIILHIFSIRLDLVLAKIIDGNPEDVVAEAQAYIRAVEIGEGFPSGINTRPWRGPSYNESSYGRGYMQRERPEFSKISAALEDALSRSFVAANPNRLLDLLDQMAKTPGYVRRALGGVFMSEGVPDYSSAGIFSSSDAANVAQTVFALPGPNWFELLESVKDRIVRQDAAQKLDGDELRSERDWFLRFRDEALSIASTSSRIKKAQIEFVVAHFLGFLKNDAK